MNMSLNLAALHHAVDQLAAIDQRKGRVVELKVFGHLTADEIGGLLGMSTRAVEREWTSARAWLDVVERVPLHSMRGDSQGE